MKYYRVGLQNFYRQYVITVARYLHVCLYPCFFLYDTRNDKKYLDHQRSSHSYTFGDIEKYKVNGKFYVRFTIEALDANAVRISDASSIRLDSYCKSYNSVTIWLQLL